MRDASGEIVDFCYRHVNQATCDYFGVSRAYLIGSGMLDTTPGIKESLLADFIRCLETGEPLILNDFTYDNDSPGHPPLRPSDTGPPAITSS